MKELLNKIKKYFVEIWDRIKSEDIPDSDQRVQAITGEEREFVKKLHEMDNVEKLELAYAATENNRQSFEGKYAAEVNEDKARENAKNKKRTQEKTNERIKN